MFPHKQYNEINAFIRAHLHDLTFTDAEELPESPIEWVAGHFEGMELAGLLGVLYGLILRGTDPADCARYALDQNLPLPFAGFEQLLYEAMILGMRDRGYSRLMVARIIEILAVMAEGAAQLIWFTATPPSAREVVRA